MIVNELRYLIFQNYYRQIRFSKENSYHSIKHQKKKDLHLFATKLTEKMPSPSNTKQYYNSYLKRKKHKISKTNKNNYSSTKGYRKLKHC